ncbi:hypothetical protein QAD02_008769 [Eretmocerus hayati]|uniref:Uncharacterized protein n=1 Tax=Eretmocerus hayati TaxID=131215 RepID=A0ACC2N9V6_9HYME|nr:hypothetical protein QAD02_008769 [Eretmocerus hayati]
MRLSRSVPLLLTVCFIALLAVEDAEACSCAYTHPQTHFCSAHFVLIVRVKERISLEHETAYKVKINRRFKLSNESLSEYLYDGLLYTASMDSLCGVNLQTNETYVVSGRVYAGKPRLSLCDLTMRWADASKRQRKGFKGLYAKGCACDVRYTSFERKGEALHRGGGRVCPWEGNPGPLECQDKHGVCMPSHGRCLWMPSKPYDLCITEHHRERLHSQQQHHRQHDVLL